MTDSEQPLHKRRKLTDIRFNLKTVHGITTFDASKFKLAEHSRFFRELFGSEHFQDVKEHEIVVPDDATEAVEVLLDFLHTKGTGDLTRIETYDFKFCLKLAQAVDQFEVQHDKLDRFLEEKSTNTEEASQLARSCPLLASRIITMAGFIENAKYDAFMSAEDLGQLERLCDFASVEMHNRATLMLKWFVSHPQDNIKLAVSKLSGTYVRCVLVPYALRYPRIAKKFQEYITVTICNSSEDEVHGLKHGMAWGLAFIKDGDQLRIDQEWMGLPKIWWGGVNRNVRVKLSGFEVDEEYDWFPVSVAVSLLGFSD